MATAFKNRRLVRLLAARGRLFVSFAAGLVLFLVLPEPLRLETRRLVSWDLTTLIYVAAALRMIAQSDVTTCHDRAALYDEGDWAILFMVIASAAASFVAIFAELAAIKSQGLSVGALIITGATVALSWTFTHVVFTLHYANIYYFRPKAGKAPPGGLIFPGGREPDYRDFLYYGFVIGCTAQTADVNTSPSAMRRLTLVHGIVSFVFNTTILVLMINIGASLVSGKT